MRESTRPRLTYRDRRRFRSAQFLSWLLTVVVTAYLVLDAASLFFGAFEWPTTLLKTLVVGCLVLHAACAAAVFGVVSEHRRYGNLRSIGLLIGATAPASACAFVAFHAGAANPAAVTLPICLGLITVATWGVASIAKHSLQQDTSEPTSPFSN